MAKVGPGLASPRMLAYSFAIPTGMPTDRQENPMHPTLPFDTDTALADAEHGEVLS